MAHFTKWNNPAKKRRKKKISYDERVAMAAQAATIDKKLGYEIAPEFYNEKIIKGGKK